MIKKKNRKPLVLVSDKLTPRQRAYARYRFHGHDPEQSYRMAGYNGDGRHQAYIRKLENKPKIRVFIQKLFDKSLGEYNDGLTSWERRFVDEYLIDFNRHRAVAAAGILTTNPGVMAGSMLRRPHVIEAIEKSEKERSIRTRITADRILQLLWTWANFDVRRLYDEKGNLKNIHELDGDCARAIRKIKQFAGSEYWTKKKKWKKGKIVEFIIEERKSAAELIGRHLEMFTDRIKGDFDSRIAGVLITRGISSPKEWKDECRNWEKTAPKMIPSGFKDGDDK